MSNAESEVVRELRETVGRDVVDASPKAITALLRDNSWLSPLLTAEFDERARVEGPTLGVVAIVKPRTEQQVVTACRAAVRHRVPITPRGGGTSNFGLITPERGGLIFDLRDLKDEPRVENGGVRAGGGVLQGDMERIAREQGRELSLLTTTYASATAAGWIVGGHVGLGSSTYGAVWDGIVHEVRVVTATEEPQVLTLRGNEVHPVLHTFGAFGIVTELVQHTEARHEWIEAVAFFPRFAAASRYVTELSRDERYRHRVATAQEEAMMPAFKALAPVMQPGAGVLMILDEQQLGEATALAESLGGSFTPWQKWQLTDFTRPPIAGMVYGHRMLWVKRLLPEAAFLHVYFDPEDPDTDAGHLKERFGDDVLVEMKFIRSPWMRKLLGYSAEGTLPAAVITIARGEDPDAVHEVMRFCDESGIRYQNPHTGVVEDNGLYPDMAPLLRFKNRVDPYNLLNPGKVRSVEASAP
jgi:FAD/FMN-containing dehydrogenase